MLKKRSLLILVLMLTLSLFVSACGPKRSVDETQGGNNGSESNEEVKVEKPEKLVVWANDEEKQFEAVKDNAMKFTEQTGIEVEVLSLSMLDQIKNLALDGPAGKGPDVFFQPHDRIGDIVLQGLASPVDLGDSKSEYTETAVDAVTYDGDVWGAPAVVETYGLFYNKDLVEAPKTLEELMTIAEEHTDESQDKYGFLMEAANFYFAYPFFAGYGGYVFNKENGAYDPKNIGLANEGAVKGGELIQSWFDNGYIPKEINGDIMNGLFTSGKTAVVITGPWNIPVYTEALGDKLGAAPLPLLDNGEYPKSFIGVKSWMVSSYSEHPDYATELIKFLTNKDSSTHYYEVAGEMPPRNDVIDSPAVTDNPLMAAIAEQSTYGEPMPSIAEMQQVWEPMGNALQFIANGDNVQDVLEEAVQQIKDRIAASGAQ